MKYILLNGLAVFVGALIGMTIGKRFTEDQNNAVMTGAGLVVIVLGVKGGISSENTLLLLGCLTLGGFLGAAMDIDGKFVQMGEALKRMIRTEDAHFTEGLVAVLMLHLVGSMAILGPIETAIDNDPTILLVKTVLDFATVIIFGATYGFGMSLSGVAIILYQGVIYLLAGLLVPIITPEIAHEISAVGSILYVGLGLNLLGIGNIKVSNLLPAVFLPILYFWGMQLF